MNRSEMNLNWIFVQLLSFLAVFLSHIGLCMRVFQQLFATSLPHIKLFSFGQLAGTIVRD